MSDPTSDFSVCITGATGGVGRNAVAYALARGWRVTATGRNLKVLSELKAQGAHAIAQDLTQASENDLSLIVQGHDAVWHCAGLATPWDNKENFIDINVVASSRVFNAAAREGVPIMVHLSSPSLYFDYHDRTRVREDQVATRFASAYAYSKWVSERDLKKYADIHPQTRLVILRPRVIFGPHDKVVFPRLMRLVRQRQGVLTLPGSGTALLDFCHVDNLLHAMALATMKKVKSGSVYNISNGEPVILKDVIRQFFRLIDKPVRIQTLPYPLMSLAAKGMECFARHTHQEPLLTQHSLGALAFDMTLDISKAYEELSYSPVMSMENSLAQTAAWIKKEKQEII